VNWRAITPLSNLGEAEMTPRHEISVARALSIRELEALAILREIRELGAFVLIDVDGRMCIYHRVQVPSLLKSRLAAYRTEATRLLLECDEANPSTQVTPGQCPACGTHSVFSVLVTESADAGDRTPLRVFYRCNRHRCNRAPLSRRYYYHDCECTDGEQANACAEGCNACVARALPRGMPWTDGEQANACAEGGRYDHRNIRT
jgi:hypothetical protein